MQVYREPNTPLFEVKPDRWRKQGVPSPIELETCAQGTRVLTTIIQDLKDELERPREFRLTTIKDTTNLITLVSYFLYEPLLTLSAAQAEAPSDNPEVAAIQTGFTAAVDLLLSRLYDALILVQRIFRRYSATTRMIQQVYEYAVSHNYEDNLRIKIPAFSPLELLLRVVTTRQQWDDHEALFQAYRRLNVNGVLYPAICIPKAGFACLGVKANAGAICVLGFSADHWKGFKEMNDFVRELRDSRRHNFVKPQMRQIIRWSKTLHQQYSQQPQLLLSLIANPPGSFDHEDELASPFYCDYFRPRDRCTRCQALFKYTVIQAVRSLETHKNRKNVDRQPNQNWSCAEVFAHFFCQQLTRNGRH